jgi:hypothetical protein
MGTAGARHRPPGLRSGHCRSGQGDLDQPGALTLHNRRPRTLDLGHDWALSASASWRIAGSRMDRRLAWSDHRQDQSFRTAAFGRSFCCAPPQRLFLQLTKSPHGHLYDATESRVLRRCIQGQKRYLRRQRARLRNAAAKAIREPTAYRKIV